MELFNNVESDVTLTYKLYTYLDRSSEEAEDTEASWNFERDPKIDDEVKILKGEKNKCFQITLPKSSPAVSKGKEIYKGESKEHQPTIELWNIPFF